MGLEQLLGSMNEKLDKFSERLVRLEEREKHRGKEIDKASERLETGDEAFSGLGRKVEALDSRLHFIEDRGKDFGTKVWEVLKMFFTALMGGFVTLFIWWLTR